MGVTDLNWKNHSGHAAGSDIFGVKHVYGPARFFPGNRPPANTFRRCVKRYQGERYVKRFRCFDQYLSMAFAQLTYRESLRDIEACLRAHQSKLYHMAIRSRVVRSTLSDANEQRDWRIYADFAQALIRIARPLYAEEDLGLELDNTVYALDASTIDLCLSVFPWALFRSTKSAVKLHTLLDLRGNIPTFIHISDGKLHDVNVLDILLPEAGAFYIMDRGYVDFERLFTLHMASAFFVIRAKSNTQYQRRYSRPVDKSTGVKCDQTIVLTGVNTATDYPQSLRRIKYHDENTGKTFNFLTNNLAIPAQTVADLYRYRWQIGVPGEGRIIQSVKVRPRPIDSGLVAWEAPWRESKTVKPSDHVLALEYSNVPGCNVQ